MSREIKLLLALVSAGALLLFAGCPADDDDTGDDDSAQADDDTGDDDSAQADDDDTGDDDTGDDDTGDDDATPPEITIGELYDDIFAPMCASCHTVDHSTGLDLSGIMVAYSNIVDVPAFQLAEMDRVEPGDSDQSYLFHKVNNSYLDPGGSGEPMPSGESPLSANQKNRLRSWIDDGAPQ